jgi:PleD family two-component response regulator
VPSNLSAGNMNPAPEPGVGQPNSVAFSPQLVGEASEATPEPGKATSPARHSILVANDHEWTARSLESILEAEGYQVRRAYTGCQAIDRALAQRPDLIVLDMSLPDLSGPEICRQLRAEPSIGHHTPIILTTAGGNGRSRQLEALEAGGWDFAPQPFDGPLFLARVRTFLQARAAWDAARAKAFHDATTGLYTREGLEWRLSEIASSARRRGEPLACLLLQPAAPQLLEAAAAVLALENALIAQLREVTRTSDVLARLAPLRFAVVAPATGLDGATSIAGRLASALHVDHLPPVRIGGYAATVVDGLSTTQWLERAAEALARTTPDHPFALGAPSSAV